MLVAKTKENLRNCRCMECPSYTAGCKIRNYPVNLFKLMDDLDNIALLKKVIVLKKIRAAYVRNVQCILSIIWCVRIIV